MLSNLPKSKKSKNLTKIIKWKEIFLIVKPSIECKLSVLVLLPYLGKHCINELLISDSSLTLFLKLISNWRFLGLTQHFNVQVPVSAVLI